MPYYPPAFDTYARYTFGAADRSYLAETMPTHLATGTTTPSVAGRLELAKIRLPVPSTVTNIIMVVTSVGVTLTSGQCFAALYTGAGVLLAQTADQAVAWVSTGVKTMALAGGAQALAAGNYYVGFWYNGTTSPTWPRGSTVGSVFLNAGSAAPNLFYCTADTGLTTTAPGPMGAQTAAATSWWVALS